MKHQFSVTFKIFFLIFILIFICFDVALAASYHGYSSLTVPEGGTSSTLSVDVLHDMATRFSGWWYDKEKPGTGIAMEIQGQNIFLAWFVFNEKGYTTWYTAYGTLTNENSWTGELQKWTGWSFPGPYSPPVSQVSGSISLNFNKGATNRIDMSATVDGKSSVANLTNFMDDFSPGAPHSPNITGWWWDPSYNGMGFFLDAQGNNMAMVWYNYRSDRSPRWWTSNGDFSNGATNYYGHLDGWMWGQCPGCPYNPPTIIPNTAGDISIVFLDDSHATLTAGTTVINIERFNF